MKSEVGLYHCDCMTRNKRISFEMRNKQKIIAKANKKIKKGGAYSIYKITANGLVTIIEQARKEIEG
jgi:hypothetical protein